MNTKKIYFWIGAALITDGIMSIVWGKSCSDICFNNSNWGNLVRIARVIMGCILIIYNRK